MDDYNMQDASLLDERSLVLGSGRFKTLLKHLRTYLPSLRTVAARQHQQFLSPAAAVDNDMHQQCCSVEDDESLQCDELVAELEQRVTQLENVLTRYNSRYEANRQRNRIYYAIRIRATCPRVIFFVYEQFHIQVFAPRHYYAQAAPYTLLCTEQHKLIPADENKLCRGVVCKYRSCSITGGAEFVPTGTHHHSSSNSTQYNGTLFSQPPAASALLTISSSEACFDDQLGDGGSRHRVRGKSASSSCLLTTMNGGEQQIPSSNSLIVKWASLPHHALWEILKQLRWERKASGAFRSVCKGW
jgi:hypothetical protein